MEIIFTSDFEVAADVRLTLGAERLACGESKMESGIKKSALGEGGSLTPRKKRMRAWRARVVPSPPWIRPMAVELVFDLIRNSQRGLDLECSSTLQEVRPLFKNNFGHIVIHRKKASLQADSGKQAI